VYDFALGRRVKLYDPVSFPLALDMAPYLTRKHEDENGPTVYELYSVLVHFGTAMGGHYFCYTKVCVVCCVSLLLGPNHCCAFSFVGSQRTGQRGWSTMTPR
jgi:hypothetical protein